jgi:hypothetical protein
MTRDRHPDREAFVAQVDSLNAELGQVLLDEGEPISDVPGQPNQPLQADIRDMHCPSR